MTRYGWTFLLVAYCGLIYYMSDQSRWLVPVPDLFNMQDKLIHALAYAVMALLFWQAGKAWMMHRGRVEWRLLALLCVIFCSLYGMTDEWHQSFVEGRDGSVYDWMADTLGSLLLTITLKKWEFTLMSKSNSLT